MPENNLSSRKAIIIKQIVKLRTKYEKIDKCGVFFKLAEGKNLSEIFGVLDYLKFKFKEWGNINIFSYSGRLFDKNAVLVIGASNHEEVINIIIAVYLSKIIDNEEEINYLLEKVVSPDDLEIFLNNEISKNILVGYPLNTDLEVELRKYLEDFLDN